MTLAFFSFFTLVCHDDLVSSYFGQVPWHLRWMSFAQFKTYTAKQNFLKNKTKQDPLKKNGQAQNVFVLSVTEFEQTLKHSVLGFSFITFISIFNTVTPRKLVQGK